MSDTRRKEAPEQMPDDVSGLKGWGPARRSTEPGSRPPTRRITINIDADVLAIFKAEALQGRLPYQVAINQALRSHLRQRERDAREQAVQALLLALDHEAVKKKILEIRPGRPLGRAQPRSARLSTFPIGPRGRSGTNLKARGRL